MFLPRLQRWLDYLSYRCGLCRVYNETRLFMDPR